MTHKSKQEARLTINGCFNGKAIGRHFLQKLSSVRVIKAASARWEDADAEPGVKKLLFHCVHEMMHKWLGVFPAGFVDGTYMYNCQSPDANVFWQNYFVFLNACLNDLALGEHQPSKQCICRRWLRRSKINRRWFESGPPTTPRYRYSQAVHAPLRMRFEQLRHFRSIGKKTNEPNDSKVS